MHERRRSSSSNPKPRPQLTAAEWTEESNGSPLMLHHMSARGRWFNVMSQEREWPAPSALPEAPAHRKSPRDLRQAAQEI